ncbi:MAG: alpha/beta hydrolase [bacterium]
MHRFVHHAPAFVLAGMILGLLSGCVQVPISGDAILQPKPSVTPAGFAHPEAELEEFFFDGEDGTQLNAWYLSQPDAERTVLFFGGYAFYMVQSTQYLDAFLEQGVNAMLWDYRGYGRSEGEPTVQTMKSDAERAYQVVRERYGVPPDSLILHGHSLGTFVAAHVADKEPVGGLILESPITAPKDWTRTVVPWYLRLLLRFDISEDVVNEDNRRRLETIEVPTLLIAGGRDIVAPTGLAETLYKHSAARARELLVIPDGNHDDLMSFPDYHQAYRRLLDRTASGGSDG